MIRTDVQRFLNPGSVALIGGFSLTGDPAAFVQRQRDQWGENVYFVHPNGGEIAGEPIYQSALDLPVAVDLVVVSVGIRAMPDVIEACARRGVFGAVIFTSGYAETGEEGIRAEAELAKQVRALGLHVLGPNTNTNAFEKMPQVESRRTGAIGLVTQSGHQGRGVVQAGRLGVRLSRWVATGNEVDLDAADFVEYYAGEPSTSVIAGYFEGFRDGTKLRRALEAALQADKPVVCLKIGQTEKGAESASSHTGHLSGNDAVVNGLFRQYCVTRVDDLDELTETASLFAKLPADTGPGVALYGVSGGTTTLMAELAAQYEVSVPRLSDETCRELHSILPDYLSVSNPIDNGMRFLLIGTREERFRVLDLITKDPSIDALVVGVTGVVPDATATMVNDLADYRDEHETPIIVVWATPQEDADLLRPLVESGIPIFRSYRNCMKALNAFSVYRTRKASQSRRLVKPAVSKTISRSLLPAGVLGWAEGRRLLLDYGVTLADEVLTNSREEAALAATEIGFPVVMKLGSPDIPHRSELGLVEVGVEGSAQAMKVFDLMVERALHAVPNARIEGVQVQRQVRGTAELIVGVLHDQVLGPALLIGSGGVYTEIWRDVAIQPVPLHRDDVTDMLHSLRGYAILAGARSREPVDEDAIIDLAVAVSQLAVDADGRLLELDLNPVIVGPEGAVVVDVLIVGREP